MRWVVGAWGPGLLRQWLSLHREGRAKGDITAPPPTDGLKPSGTEGPHGGRLGGDRQGLAHYETTETRLETQAEPSSQQALNVMLRMTEWVLLA